MDRRRYVPAPEGLEGRSLLSLFSGNPAAKTSLTTTVQSLPQNFQQKTLRIQHLPFFLNTLQPGRFLPSDTMKDLQANLTDIAGRLHSPPAWQVDAFNNDLRNLFVEKSLSRENARLLNHAFSVVLVGAGATPTQVQALSANMNELALVDSKSIEPSRLAADDYSLVLQTALAVGRPIETPARPLLSLKDGERSENGLGGTTRQTTPTFVGTYQDGASKTGFTSMQIIDATGRVLGSSVVDKNGLYSVKLSTPLAEGTYRLQARAADIWGHFSKPSPVFVLKVVPRPENPSSESPTTTTAAQSLTPPGGPLALKHP